MSILLRLQRQYGNRYVQRVLALAGKGTGEAEAAPEVEQSIQQARGGGHEIDSRARGQMESGFGADFSKVRVHTDTRADMLNRELNAWAFTTGQDIFFRQGAYNSGSSGGLGTLGCYLGVVLWTLPRLQMQKRHAYLAGF